MRKKIKRIFEVLMSGNNTFLWWMLVFANCALIIAAIAKWNALLLCSASIGVVAGCLAIIGSSNDD